MSGRRRLSPAQALVFGHAFRERGRNWSDPESLLQGNALIARAEEAISAGCGTIETVEVHPRDEVGTIDGDPFISSDGRTWIFQESAWVQSVGPAESGRKLFTPYEWRKRYGLLPALPKVPRESSAPTASPSEPPTSREQAVRELPEIAAGWRNGVAVFYKRGRRSWWIAPEGVEPEAWNAAHGISEEEAALLAELAETAGSDEDD